MFIEDLQLQLEDSFEEHASDPGSSIERLVYVIQNLIINTFAIVEMSNSKRKRFCSGFVILGLHLVSCNPSITGMRSSKKPLKQKEGRLDWNAISTKLKLFMAKK